MISSYIINALRWMEDPHQPLLGPNIKLFSVFGLLLPSRKLLAYFFFSLHIFSVLFVCSMFADLYFMEKDIAKVLFNISLSVQSLVCICKTLSCVIYQLKWKKLLKNIASEELSQIYSQEKETLRLINRYTLYSRRITYLYWFIILLTTVVTIVSPFLTCLVSKVKHVYLGNSTCFHPQILSSWFPFDKSENPGYLVSVCVHVVMIIQGGGVIAAYDSGVIVIMTFFKGQILILREKCKNIFGSAKRTSNEQVLLNIQECHRLHNFLIEQSKAFNLVVSPVMFIYVLICSVMICCCVVQLNLDGVTTSQRLWILEYVTAAGVQLFVFCWHSNQISYESNLADSAIFCSNWWRADAKLKKHMLLLAGKLSKTFTVEAGPFTTFSMPTFIEILKGSYSFYTLFSKSTKK